MTAASVSCAGSGRSLVAAVLLLLLLLLLLFASFAEAAVLPELSAVNDVPVFALGARGDASLAPQNEGGDSPGEDFLSGSYVGALLLGRPATGFGAADVTTLALLAFVALRILAARKRDQGDDRFNANRNDDGGWFRDDEPGGDDDASRRGRQPGRTNRTRPEDLRPPDTPRRDEGDRPGGPDDPRDNPWSRRLRGQAPHEGRGASDLGGRSGGRPQATVKDRAAAMWAHLSSEPQEQERGFAQGAVAEGAHVPPDFDVDDFLEGARTLYVRLQQAWAARKLDDIAPFISEALLALLQKQAEGDPTPSELEVRFVNATLKDTGHDGDTQWADVLFNMLMRSGAAAQPLEINEQWRFERGPASGGMWRLTQSTPV